MSYKLTIEFKTKQELLDFLSESKTSQGTIASDFNKASEDTNTAAIEPKVEAPKKAPTKKAPAKEVVVETKSEPAAPVNEPVVEPKAPVVEAPVNRDALVKRATELVAELKKAGLHDAEVMPEIHKVYTEAGCPLNLRISQFDDVQLVRFMPLFEKKVKEVQSSKTATASFI